MDLPLPVLQYDEEPEILPSGNSSSHSAASGSTQQHGSWHPAHAAERGASSGHGHATLKRRAAGPSQQPDKDAMQALSKERKRRAFIGMLRLLEDGAKDPQQLHALIAPMSDEEMLQVAEERSLAGKCGNPLCTNPFTWREPRRKYRATADNIYKLEGDCYCSKSCGSFVRQLAAGLVNPMDRIQPQALQQYLSQPSHRPKQGTAAQGGGVETMKAIIQERDPFQLIHEAEDAGKQLDAAVQRSSSEAAVAVEGFIPRTQPSSHQQQLQDEESQVAPADDAPQDILQLNPVLKRADLASNSQVAAAAGTTGPGNTGNGVERQLEQYLQVHKYHQQQQLQRINKQQRHAVDVDSVAVKPATPSAVMPHCAASTSSRDSSSMSDGVGHSAGGLVTENSSTAAPAPAAAGGEHAAAAGQPPMRRRTVTFAPPVEYNCPAAPQPHPEHPVLTFTMHGPGSSRAAHSNSNGLLGELRVEPAGDAPPQQAAAVEEQPCVADGSGSGGSGSDSTPEVPEAWRLLFPPALGGVRTPVRQVLKTRPIAKVKKQQQAGQRHTQEFCGEQQLQQQQQQQLPQISPSAVRSRRVRQGAAANNAVGAHVAAASSHGASAAAGGAGGAAHTSRTQKQAATGHGSAQQLHQQTFTPVHSAGIAGQPRQGPANGKGPISSTAKAGTCPRRFTPTVRPRRSVVVLDSVPGVIVKQRGGLSKCNSSSAGDNGHAAQPLQPQIAADRAPVGAAVPSQSLARSGKQQQQRALGALGAAAGSVSVNSISAVNMDLAQAGCSSDRQSNDRQQQDNKSITDQYLNSDAAVGSSSGRTERPHVLHDHVVGRPQYSGRDSSTAAAADEYSDTEDDDSFGSDGDAADSLSAGSQDEDMSSDSASDTSKGGGDMSKQLQGALHSLLPFLDTKGVTVHLSDFGLLWNTMHAWISPATITYVNNKQAAVGAAVDPAVQEAGSRPAATASSAAPAAALTAELEAVPSAYTLQQRAALANMLAPALALVVEQLSITVPQAELTRQLHALVRSFYISGPLPALQLHQWQTVASLMLAALSAWHVPSMRRLFSRSQPAGSKLEVMLTKLGTDVDRFMALLELFEIDM